MQAILWKNFSKSIRASASVRRKKKLLWLLQIHKYSVEMYSLRGSRFHVDFARKPQRAMYAGTFHRLVHFSRYDMIPDALVIIFY